MKISVKWEYVQGIGLKATLSVEVNGVAVLSRQFSISGANGEYVTHTEVQ